eukprot:m.74098 g.74098  ORF g.74098 m.74098 type:complete len:87 (+) comp35876_c0_seq9:933-1193(+)
MVCFVITGMSHFYWLFLFAGNPVADAEDYRIEVLIAVRRLERLDKDEFNEEERGEAEELYEQRKNQEVEGEDEEPTEDVVPSEGED